jgi:hypothetical protein
MKNPELSRTLQKAYDRTDVSGLRRTRESLSRLKMKLALWKGPSDTQCGYQKQMILDGVVAVRGAYQDDAEEIKEKINRATVAFVRANLSEPGFGTMGNEVVVQCERISKRNFYVTVNDENKAVAIFHMSPKLQENAASFKLWAPSSAAAFGAFMGGYAKQINQYSNIALAIASGAVVFVAIKALTAIRDLNRFTPNRFIERMTKIGDVVESALKKVEQELQAEKPVDGAK